MMAWFWFIMFSALVVRVVVTRANLEIELSGERDVRKILEREVLSLKDRCTELQNKNAQVNIDLHIARQRVFDMALHKIDVAIQQPLPKDDIRRLLQLCHPDRHNNSQLAQDMTAKLLKMRK